MTSGSDVELVGPLLRRAAKRLETAGVERPREEATFLLAETAGTTRAWLMAHPEAELPASAVEGYLVMVERRAERVPASYLVGHREFFGLDFLVTPDVLVPRPETELLVEMALASSRKLLEANPNTVAVDLGTGSGVIGIALASNEPRLQILAIDRSPEALEVAGQNARRQGVADRISFRLGNLLEEIEQPFDLLVANLPYIPSGRIKELMPEVSQHEPRLALDGGTEGTDLIRETLRQAARRDRPPASMLFEIGEGQGLSLADAARQLFPEAAVAVRRDYAGMERILSVEIDRR